MARDTKFIVRHLALAVLCWLVGLAAAEDVMLSVNIKKPLAVVSDKFLSITLDPVLLFNSDMLRDIERSTSMAKALAPAYVRIGGPRSNSYVFERGLYPQETHPDPGYTFSETHWIHVHQWAERAGLDVIACIAPQQSDSFIAGSAVGGGGARASAWDPRNALDLISFSDHMGYNTSWQLGYECQTRCDVSGAELGRDVQRLRSMLDAFPRYAERGLIAGPDVVTHKTRLQQQYLQDYFNAASAALSAVTWHPDFAGITLEAEGVSMHHDDLAVDKDSFYRVAGRHISKKPLWIAESRPEECKRQFLGALVWARRLGNSAKLGIQVLMRQPDNSNLFRPTPDYWVSVLHKMLVGREVLDTKIATGNRSHVHFYCQCAKPSARYERGSLAVFGINLTPSKVTASLKGLKLKVVHKYILLPGFDAPNRMFSETVLLNNEMLDLIDGKEVPDVQPVVSRAEKEVKLKLPSGGIGFWVLPGLKIKSCMGHEDEIADKAILRKLNKRLEEPEIEEEMEPEDESSHEVAADADDSVEEKKSSLRQPQLQQGSLKRSPVRRSTRHEKDELEDRKPRRFDSTRHDFDRLEKIIKRNHHSVNLKSGGTHGVFENNDEDDDGSSEEGVIRRPKGQKLDSGEVIRAKLHEYKKLLADYENKKKHRELVHSATKSHAREEHDDPSNKGMETEKVIEALTLITKVEGAMKGLEKGAESGGRPTGAPATLGTSNFNDVTAGLKRSSGAPDNSNDGLLDEVLNTEKSKRTSIPAKIEDQLRALYRLLSDEKDKKEVQSSQRHRRDLDKRLGDDPLGLRRDSIYLRKRTKTEEAKERILERVNERKQRLRERQEQLRREKEEQKRETLDSYENDFYGFQHREPLKDFPEGDLYFQTGSTEYQDTDYDSITEENTQNNKKQPQRLQSKNRLNATKVQQETVKDDHEDIWLEEGEGNPMPNEFYENMNLKRTSPKENLKEYGELWEAEALHKNEENEQRTEQTAEYANHEVVTEKQLPESEDRRAKDKAVQQLMNYYETAVPNEQNYDFADVKKNQYQQQHQQQHLQQHQQQQHQQQHLQQHLLQHQQQHLQQYQQQPQINYQPQMTYQQDPRTAQAASYVDTSRYYADPNAYMQAGQAQYHRAKRNANDLEAVLHREMITQDDNNLRDCQCRVIRGIEECKDCNMQQQERYRAHLGTSEQALPSPVMSNYAKAFRYRRDVENSEVKNENEDSGGKSAEETIVSSSQDRKVDIVNSNEEGLELEDAVNGEISLEDSNETKEIDESATETIEEQLKLENDSEKLAANRLPRKTESDTNFFRKPGKTNTKLMIKENLKNNKQENATTTESPGIPISAQSNTGNERETLGEHFANIRSIDDPPPQVSGTATPIATSNEYKKAITQNQSILIESKSVTNSNTVIESVAEKSSARDSDTKRNITDDAKYTDTDEKTGQEGADQTTVASILSGITATDAKSKTATVKYIQKVHVTVAEPKNKPKSNSSLKIEEMMKTRQARLTTRAEALAALKKENESRRTKKMIEASMKIIDNENARFAEYQKRRHDQLERLKLKLRAKREKMLQQYRDELLEAINESSDPKERNLRRRDLLEKYQRPDEDSRKNDMITDPEKLAYIMRYRPVKYTPKDDAYASVEEDRYVPVVKIMRPCHESRRRQISSRNKAKTYGDVNNNEYEPNKDRKRSISLDKPFRDDDANDDQEYRMINMKRSPYSFIDTFASITKRPYKKPEPMEGDSGEFYTQQEQEQQQPHQQLQQSQMPTYYPSIPYHGEDVIPVDIEYNQQPETAQRHQQHSDVNFYHINPAYEQQPQDSRYYRINQDHMEQSVNNYYDANQEATQEQPVENYYNVKENVEHQQPAKHSYSENQEDTQQPAEKYYNGNTEVAEEQHQPKRKFYEINPPYYEPIEQNYRKSKRSSLKILEIDPSLYEDEPDYNLQELFMRPSSQYSRRSYRHDPYHYTNKRYRRDAGLNTEESLNMPLSFSLGLEKSKMHKKAENNELSDDFVRRKRVADDELNTKTESPFQAGSLINKNVKKVYRADYDNKYRKSAVSPRYVKLDQKTIDLYNHPAEDDSKIQLRRRKRSSDEIYNIYKVVQDNRINRSEESEMDEIWNNIIEMKQDEQLLQEYNRQKEQIIHNFKESPYNLKKYITSSTTISPNDHNNCTTDKAIAKSTTQTNIESMLVDAIPKLQTVITGGLEKAQNLTGSLEDFIDNFDDQFAETTENPKGNLEPAENVEANEGRFSHNVFQTMAGSVKKFFGLLSGIANIFHGH